jgi:phosphatidylglycerol:prolipoprotein diacylglycerol transferase
MQFPVYLWAGPVPVHPHLVFEALAYAVGALLYRWLRRRQGDALPDPDRWSIVAAAGLGACIGAKLMYWASSPELMLGRRSTGDLFAVPALVAIGVGRIGCFLTGLDDETYGVAASLPWAIDFGDGIPRHPTEIYEMVFVWALAISLLVFGKRLPREGDIFKVFLAAYVAFRLWLEAIKPGIPFLGLNAIQWVCAATLCYYGWTVLRDIREHANASGTEASYG